MNDEGNGQKRRGLFDRFQSISLIELMCVLVIVSAIAVPAFRKYGPWWEETALTWVPIKGGTFQMGSTVRSSEQPIHEVIVKNFEMLQTEVTVGQYKQCVEDGECTAPNTVNRWCNWEEKGRAHHPVNCVTWRQAKKYCAWAGGRLPSEAEWEYAARSGGQDITYPWGNETATCDYAVMDDGGIGCGTDSTMAVCSKPAGNTAQGLCDMAGNVWEWVEDYWHYGYDGAPTDGTAWVNDPPRTTSARVERGGTFYDHADDLRAASRYAIDTGRFSSFSFRYDLGFRCAGNGGLASWPPYQLFLHMSSCSRRP